MRTVVVFILSFFAFAAQAQLLRWTPEFPGDASTITVTVDAAFGNQGLLGHTAADVYIHTGVITNQSTSPTAWKYVKYNQSFTDTNYLLKATPDGANRWTFTITNVRAFYGVPQGETIEKIALLFRSGNGTKVQRNADGSDMYIPLSNTSNLQVRVTTPAREPTFVPSFSLCTNVGSNMAVEGKSSANASLKLFYNGTQVASASGTSVSGNVQVAAPGLQRIIVEATPLATTTYHFTGNGQWNNAGNWQGGQIPPATVPSGAEVIVQPSPGGSCTLDVPQAFAAGARLTVAAGAQFIVPTNVQIQGGDPGASPVVRDTIEFYVAGPTVVADIPAGVASNGVTYHNGGTAATLVLYAPNKNNIVVVGDFNQWKPDIPYQMKRTADGLRYWVRIEGLTPGQEYAYQYQIDCNLKVADYNTEKVLDPWNDKYINEAPYTDRYPNLKAYPEGKASGIVSVLEPGKPVYSWSNATLNFQRPDKRNIMVYELLVRDFLARNDWKTLRDTLNYLSRLGINAIHLMPFNEFEGNNSWGYNPNFMFAVDKFYGPENQLREFIDSCHGRGIAVIMDMVLNHQFGTSPLIQMYWDAANSRPAANSPWANPVPKHGFNVGYDLNHEAPATQEFVQRVMAHWLTKYKLDGFRWDLSKGFTQKQTCDNNGGNCDVGAWSAYDQSRVDIWQRIYNQSQQISPNCYMILEHLGQDDEEAELASRGMLLWGKMTNEFSQSAMGYMDNSDFGRAFHTTRWSKDNAPPPPPHLMAYAESHDEERLAWKNVRFGNAGVNHNTRSLSVYTRRLQAVAAFLFTIPGPKLMWQFGELAYDSSINMCEDLSIGDCRTAPKPPAWAMPTFSGIGTQNYDSSAGGNFNFRRPLKNMYSRLLTLRTRYPQYLPAFVTSDLDFNLGGTVKSQRIRSNALNMVVIGNFDVSTQTGNVVFPFAGTWYLYAHNVSGGVSFGSINGGLSASGITVGSGNLSQNFNLPAGTFLLFTDREIGPPN